MARPKILRPCPHCQKQMGERELHNHKGRCESRTGIKTGRKPSVTVGMSEEDVVEREKQKHREYYLNNKEEAARKTRERYLQNPEHFKQVSKDWYEANKERAKKRQDAYNAANRDQVRESQKAYWKAHPDRRKEISKAEYQRNNAKRKEYQDKYKKENKEKAAAQNKIYYEAHKDEYKARARKYGPYPRKDPAEHNAVQREYYRTHKQDFIDNVRIRFHRERCAEGTHTKKDILEIWERQGRQCAVPNCTHPISESGKNRYTIDHIKPIIRQGTNWPWNIQCLCSYHNKSKGDKDEVQWCAAHGITLPSALIEQEVQSKSVPT